MLAKHLCLAVIVKGIVTDNAHRAVHGQIKRILRRNVLRRCVIKRLFHGNVLRCSVVKRLFHRNVLRCSVVKRLLHGNVLLCCVVKRLRRRLRQIVHRFLRHAGRPVAVRLHVLPVRFRRFLPSKQALQSALLRRFFTVLRLRLFRALLAHAGHLAGHVSGQLKERLEWMISNVLIHHILVRHVGIRFVRIVKCGFLILKGRINGLRCFRLHIHRLFRRIHRRLCVHRLCRNVHHRLHVRRLRRDIHHRLLDSRLRRNDARRRFRRANRPFSLLGRSGNRRLNGLCRGNLRLLGRARHLNGAAYQRRLPRLRLRPLRREYLRARGSRLHRPRGRTLRLSGRARTGGTLFRNVPFRTLPGALVQYLLSPAPELVVIHFGLSLPILCHIMTASRTA